jgi:hypothetical protein
LLGEQYWRAAGPALCQRALLPGDFLFQLLVDGDERLAFHLVVPVTQVGGAVGVAGEGAVMLVRQAVAQPRFADLRGLTCRPRNDGGARFG